jgi:hypothetical protein
MKQVLEGDDKMTFLLTSSILYEEEGKCFDNLVPRSSTLDKHLHQAPLLVIG